MTAFPWQIAADSRLRRREWGRVLIGGAPLGIVRLTERGAQIATELFAGRPVGNDPSRVALANRLVDRGMAHPDPSVVGDDHHQTLAVVIPVRDDPDGLQRTRRALAGSSHVDRIVVVDDGSVPALGAQVEPQGEPNTHVEIIRNPSSLGPAGARNAGLAHLRDHEASADGLICFCDAGVEIDHASIDRLLAHFSRTDVVAVAPRIMVRDAPGSPSILDRYEQQHSPLDLGPLPSPVRTGSTVTYVPTACLLVRRSALRATGPFDPDLRFGEDVDLVWRLGAVGEVRYEPRAVATHPRRGSVRAMCRQRFQYGSAAGPLGKRHGQAVAPLRASMHTSVVLGLTLSGHPLLAVVASAALARSLVPKLTDLDERNIEAIRFASTGIVSVAAALARAANRAWWPLLAGCGMARPTRGLARRWLAMSLIERMINERTLDPRCLAMSMLDDLSYGAGVWYGAAHARTLRPITPVVTRAREAR